MEPLFQLNIENIDILLVNTKERLMLHDEYSQVCIVRKTFKVRVRSPLVTSYEYALNSHYLKIIHY